MRILFMGTPDFAAVCLKSLIDNQYELVGVVSQPDKPKGRGHKLAPPPVKVLAEENNIPVFQPLTFKNGAFSDVLAKTQPDLLVVVAYGRILPKYVLDFPKYGAVNVHASLLPKYRGAAPIQWSIINGETHTGITTMFLGLGLVDTGDMLLKEIVKIGENETTGELFNRLSHIGAEVLIKTLKKLEAGTLYPEKQDDSQSSNAPMIDKVLAVLDFTKTGREIRNLVRGLNPAPLAYTLYRGEVMKVIEVDYEAASHVIECGTIIGYEKGKGLKVSVGDGYIYIKSIQFKGKKPMTVEAYLNGHSIEASVKLGV